MNEVDWVDAQWDLALSGVRARREIRATEKAVEKAKKR